VRGSRGTSESPGGESAASVRGDRPEELPNEISNLVDAIAHGALPSSPTLAERLVQAELELAAKEQRAALEQGVADAVSTPRCVQFYEQFVSALPKRLKENACCRLGGTTLPLAQLSCTLVAVQSNPRNDFIRRR
jgi:hypothetical protein